MFDFLLRWLMFDICRANALKAQQRCASEFALGTTIKPAENWDRPSHPNKMSREI